MNTVSFLEFTSALSTLAPLEASADFDNTGWILSIPSIRRLASTLLCVDLTPAVTEEARQLRVGAIIAYHPPLFRPIKSLDTSIHTHQALLKCAEYRIPVYSPHTALDAAEDGLNDWLCARCGPGKMTKMPGTAGRILTLPRASSVANLVLHLKRRLSLEYVRVAAKPGTTRLARIRTIGVCAGSGASSLAGLEVDAWVTGEVAHHDALAATQRGIVVLQSEHARTERPYLPVLAKRLAHQLGGRVKCLVSSRDQDFHRLG